MTTYMLKVLFQTFDSKQRKHRKHRKTKYYSFPKELLENADLHKPV